MHADKPRAFGGDGTRAMELAAEKAAASDALVWYINPESRTPLWIQYVILWVKRTVFRIKFHE